MADPYKILGISKNATDGEIKKAYRTLARKYHPDLNSGNKQAEARFKEVNNAYQILNDKQKKAQYDQFGDVGAASGAYSGFGGQKAGSYRYTSNGTFDINDIFGEIFKGERSGFSNFSGYSGGTQKGEDLSYSMDISFKDAVLGKVMSLSIEGRKLNIRIPPNIKDGEQIKVRGQGRQGQAARGDLKIKIHVASDNRFRIKGNALYTTVDVPLKVALFGGSATVESVDNKFKIKIPKGTSGGKLFKIKGSGIASRTRERGDLYAEVRIIIPKFSGSEIEKLKEIIK